jgi:hypothetical protein
MMVGSCSRARQKKNCLYSGVKSESDERNEEFDERNERNEEFHERNEHSGLL